MKRGIGTEENRELAYRVYALFGGRNVPRILDRLERRYGLKVSKQTLYKWKQEGDWDGRMASADARREGAETLTFNERMLHRVVCLIGKYEEYYETNADALRDAQAAYAYTNLVRTAMELSGRMNFWETKEPQGSKADTLKNGGALL